MSIKGGTSLEKRVHPRCKGQLAQAGLREARRNRRSATEVIGEFFFSTFAGPASYRTTDSALRRAQYNSNIEKES
jgi:hypothetical protein